jgi:hypothetical protein
MSKVLERDETLAPDTGRTEDLAYRDGRIDENRRVRAINTADADAAYARGRRDERSRRRGSPLLTLLLLVVVAIGAVLIYYAIQNGSFSDGGKVVDQKLSNAAATVQAPLRGAADKAGAALQNAGSQLKRDAGSNPN